MITVFTPTYNRAHTLRRLYESLLLQTCSEFEWLIVDDGSTDRTESLIQSFIAEGHIDITYYRQENGGKHRAINNGVSRAKGEWFFIVDSDDYLPPDAIKIIKDEGSVVYNVKEIAGVCGIKNFPNQQRVGGELKYNILYCNNIELRYKYHIKGDLAEVWKRDVLIKFPFPEFEDEKFMDESVVWFRIAQDYDIKFFNRNIYICEYYDDGLTNNIRSISRNSPQGTMLYCMQMVSLAQVSLWAKIKAAINYWRYTWNYRRKRIGPLWWMYIFYPIGIFFYWNDLKHQG